jgi:hypothetical protein
VTVVVPVPPQAVAPGAENSNVAEVDVAPVKLAVAGTASQVTVVRNVLAGGMAGEPYGRLDALTAG